MFMITLENVGHKNVSRAFPVKADTLDLAEDLATLECLTVTGSKSIELDYLDDLEYAVVADDGIAGLVQIRSLGE